MLLEWDTVAPITVLLESARMRIRGQAKSGMGMASRAITGERLQKRAEAFALDLVPGTLNVRIRSNIRAVVADLGTPHVFIDEPWSTVGTLRAWRVRMTCKDLPTADAYITRGIRSAATALETMAATHWRSLGVEDGDPVVLELVVPGRAEWIDRQLERAKAERKAHPHLWPDEE